MLGTSGDQNVNNIKMVDQTMETGAATTSVDKTDDGNNSEKGSNNRTEATEPLVDVSKITFARTDVHQKPLATPKHSLKPIKNSNA